MSVGRIDRDEHFFPMDRQPEDATIVGFIVSGERN